MKIVTSERGRPPYSVLDRSLVSISRDENLPEANAVGSPRVPILRNKSPKPTKALQFIKFLAFFPKNKVFLFAFTDFLIILCNSKLNYGLSRHGGYIQNKSFRVRTMSETKQKTKPVRSFQISRRRMLRASALSIPMLLAIAGKAPGQFAGKASAASMLNGSIVNGELVPSPDGEAEGKNRLYAAFHNVLGDGCRCENTLFRGGYGLAWDSNGFVLSGAAVTADGDGNISVNGGNSYEYTITYEYTLAKEGSESQSGVITVVALLRIDGNWVVSSCAKTEGTDTLVQLPYNPGDVIAPSGGNMLVSAKALSISDSTWQFSSNIINYTPPVATLSSTGVQCINSPYGSQS